MITVLGICVCLYLGLILVRIMRRDYITNLLCAAAALSGIAAAWIMDLISSPILALLTANFVLRYLLRTVLAVTMGYGAYFSVSRTLLARFKPSKGSSSRVGIAINICLALIVLLAFAVLMDFFLRLAVLTNAGPAQPASPALPAPEVDLRGVAPARSVESAMERQRSAAEAFKSGLGKMREAVSEKVGTSELLEEIGCLVELLNMPEDDISWLIQNTPELAALRNNPTVLAVLNDEELIALLLRVSEGSAMAVFELGDNASIGRLLDDDQIMDSVRSLDLIALRNAVRNRKQPQ